jgi:hypothetical protein
VRSHRDAVVAAAPPVARSLNAPKKAGHVAAGKDRFNEKKLKVFIVIPLTSKVSTKDTGGGL